MRNFKIGVQSDEDEKIAVERIYSVVASTVDDAFQIAFALDGGWGVDNRDAVGMLELAKAHCSLKQSELLILDGHELDVDREKFIEINSLVGEDLEAVRAMVPGTVVEFNMGAGGIMRLELR